MTAERALDIVVLVVLLLVSVRLVPAATRMVRIYTGIRTRRLADAGDTAPPAPAAVATLAQHLGALGFRRIGERTLRLPTGEQCFEWNLVDAPTTTYVALVPVAGRSALMACYSAFADGAFVQTNYPSGATIYRPDFLAAAVPGSPEDVLRVHHEAVNGFARSHGQPLPNRSMADLLARDATFRSRHGGLTLRRRVYGFVALTALSVVASAFVLLRVVLLDR